MSRLPVSEPAIKRKIAWQPTLSVPLTGTGYTWVTLTLTLPETVDWSKTILVMDGHSFGRQVDGVGRLYGVIWRPGGDGNSATIYCKTGSTGSKTWTPECELWILDDEYAAYHLYGNWDTSTASGTFTTQTATCGDATAAQRGFLWLVNMDYPCGDGTYAGACICSDNACVSYVDMPHRDSSNNSCLYYKDSYGSANVYYSFTYVYAR